MVGDSGVSVAWADEKRPRREGLGASVELRGREELLLTVHCKSSARSPPSASSSCSSPHSLPRGNSGGSSTSNPQGLPPYLQPEQPNARLVTMRESPSGPLPPASPCQRDPLRRTFDDEGESSSAVFLVGGYAHYNCPYVWVRDGHALLGSFGTDEQLDLTLTLALTLTPTLALALSLALARPLPRWSGRGASLATSRPTRHSRSSPLW